MKTNFENFNFLEQFKHSCKKYWVSITIKKDKNALKFKEQHNKHRDFCL